MPKTTKVVLSTGKLMSSAFLDTKGIVFIQKGKKPSMESTLPIVEAVMKDQTPGESNQKVSGLIRKMIKHTNLLVSMSAVHESGFELGDHHPYSPDLTPFHYHLFPNIKKVPGWGPVSSDDDFISSVDEFYEQRGESFFTNNHLYNEIYVSENIKEDLRSYL